MEKRTPEDEESIRNHDESAMLFTDMLKKMV